MCYVRFDAKNRHLDNELNIVQLILTCYFNYFKFIGLLAVGDRELAEYSRSVTFEHPDVLRCPFVLRRLYVVESILRGAQLEISFFESDYERIELAHIHFEWILPLLSEIIWVSVSANSLATCQSSSNRSDRSTSSTSVRLRLAASNALLLDRSVSYTCWVRTHPLSTYLDTSTKRTSRLEVEGLC